MDLVNIYLKRENVLKKNSVVPILKWVGGKRQLLGEITKHIPEYKTYYEPFLGGGAVFFGLQPERAVVNDINASLICVYRVIRDHTEELIEALKQHKNEAGYFYKIRNWDRNKDEYEKKSDVQKASRIIYLNKTCYNGLFRVNRAGEFNAPFGRYKNPDYVNEKALLAMGRYLRKPGITLMNTDFEKALEGVQKGDFVYFDPPYDPVSDSANFTGYDKRGFDREEQKRLKLVCDRLDKKGIKFLLSNSATDFIFDLYKEYTIMIIKAKRSVNSKADRRGEVDEVLIKNY
jgi:DNA adenine methylase